MKKLYEFSQNNSGGQYDYDENLGEYVYIEADSPEKALEIADDIGIYFDGCQQGLDCSCCGDRWYDDPEEMLVESIDNIKIHVFDNHKIEYVTIPVKEANQFQMTQQYNNQKRAQMVIHTKAGIFYIYYNN